MDRRTALADTGLAVLAAAGARGLTHRAVDREAGVAEGSTSYYFRTRSALLEACATQLTCRTLGLFSPTPAAQSGVDALIDLAVRAVHAWIDNDGLMIRARHELLLESARHPALRPQLDVATEPARRVLEQRIERLGVGSAAARSAAVIACLDGLALAHVLNADGRRDELVESIRAVMVGLLPGTNPGQPPLDPSTTS
jgi:DNA-binding transcriptional regulator YbjK